MKNRLCVVHLGLLMQKEIQRSYQRFHKLQIKEYNKQSVWLAGIFLILFLNYPLTTTKKVSSSGGRNIQYIR